MNNNSLFYESLNRGIYGGSVGSIASVGQVCSLMWLRTTMNYQYRHGTTFKSTLQILYREGGVKRFYRGLPVALIQAPLSRFGDTAMNTGVLHYLNNNDSTKDLNLVYKTFISSLFSGVWRVNLMPIDTLKSSLQVNGKDGINILKNKVKKNGFRVMYNGSLGAYSASLLGHFPWFYTHNYLSSILPVTIYDSKFEKYSKYAFIGFSSSFVSDIASNFARVLKVFKQTNSEKISYKNAIKEIVEKDGISGFFTRGLKTKILSNGIQSVIFTIIWKTFLEVKN